MSLGGIPGQLNVLEAPGEMCPAGAGGGFPPVCFAPPRGTAAGARPVRSGAAERKFVVEIAG